MQYFVRVSVSVFVVGVFYLAVTAQNAPTPATGEKKLPVIEEKKHKNYVQKIPNSRVSFEMVAIPGGEYMMGSPENEDGRKPHEGPQHHVKVQPFWMGKMEVRWDEYDQYWRKLPGAKKPVTPMEKAADAVTRPTPPYADETFGHGREGNPVLCISYHSASKYCEWLSALTGKYYRLPTEAEWEWACRAGTTTAYSYGNDADKLGEYAWYIDNSDDLAHPVGKKKPNPWGLYDMHGNVSEWCLDQYQKDFYRTFKPNKISLNPVLLPDHKRYSHVTRGGSWLDEAEDCRSASRVGSTKDWLRRDPQRPQSIWWMTDADYVGFRVVCAVNEQKHLQNIKSKITRKSPDS